MAFAVPIFSEGFVQTFIFTLQIVSQLNFDRKSNVQIDKKRKLCGKSWSSAQFVWLTRKKTQWNKTPDQNAGLG